MIDYQILRAEVERHPYPILFATVSGAHLYGFPSPDSDYDIRGTHILSLQEAVGLLPKQETVSISDVRQGIELDLVTHDVHKFFLMLLKRNGYVLEQPYSPLVITSSDEHEELKTIGLSCITRNHSHHYLGFANTQYKLFLKDSPPRIKPLLYVYRVLLTGIHLMQSGRIEANLAVLNEEFKLPYIDDLIAHKISTAEQVTLQFPDVEFHMTEITRLLGELGRSAVLSRLPEEPNAQRDLHDLLVRVRRSSEAVARQS